MRVSPPSVFVACALFMVACGAHPPPSSRAEVLDPDANPSETEAGETEMEAVTEDASGQQAALDPNADTDGDHILDVDDACPEEPEFYNGADDEDGCPDCNDYIVLTDAWALPNIDFERRAAELTPVAERGLDFIAAYLLAHTEIVHVEVIGSAARGEPESARLALARASIAVEGLTARGVAAERVHAAGRGVRDDGLRLELLLTQSGSSYPWCNQPFADCAPSEVLPLRIFDSILFARNQSTVPEASARILPAVAATITGHPDLGPLEVIGYVARGEPRALASSRSAAVLEALVVLGIARERLVAVDGGLYAGRAADARSVRFGPLEYPGCRGIPRPDAP